MILYIQVYFAFNWEVFLTLLSFGKIYQAIVNILSQIMNFCIGQCWSRFKIYRNGSFMFKQL